MPRTPPSAADAAMLDVARSYGFDVSPAQVERWRRFGVLERNHRVGRGQGRGSTSTAPDGAAEAAAAMARFSGQGQSRNMALLRWFGHVGLPLNAAKSAAVPEPPIDPVRSAMIWFDRRSLASRLAALTQSTSTGADERADKAYELVQQLIARARLTDPLLSDRMRSIVLTDRDLPGERRRVQTARDAAVHALVAHHVGLDTVGPGLVVDSLGSLGVLPIEVTSAVSASIHEDDLVGTRRPYAVDPPDWTKLIRAAPACEFREARDTARNLLQVAALLQILRWGTPDLAIVETAADRFRRHGWGLLLYVGIAVLEPGNLVPITTMLLDPQLRENGKHLLQELAAVLKNGDIASQMDGMVANLKAAAERPRHEI